MNVEANFSASGQLGFDSSEVYRRIAHGIFLSREKIREFAEQSKIHIVMVTSIYTIARRGCILKICWLALPLLTVMLDQNYDNESNVPTHHEQHIPGLRRYQIIRHEFL